MPKTMCQIDLAKKFFEFFGNFNDRFRACLRPKMKNLARKLSFLRFLDDTGHSAPSFFASGIKYSLNLK